MPNFITRRDFLRHAALTFASVHHAGRMFVPRAPRVPLSLRVAIVRGGGPRLDGAQLGLEEAMHAAALFGGDVTLLPVDAAAPRPRGISAVIGDADPERCLTLAESAPRDDVLFMNVACAADDLRNAHCGGLSFHVAPSEAMLRDATSETHGATATAWDASLQRFGADTLNQRFRTRFGRAMTTDAWTSWLAMKILWEASLRARTTDARLLAAFLARDTTQFDGHKGRPLSFRAWDHQLRQPLYARRGDELVEVPDARGSDASRDVLDRIGTRAAESTCRIAE